MALVSPSLLFDRVEHFRLELFQDLFRFGHVLAQEHLRNPNETR